MERFAISIVAGLLLAFVLLGVWVGLRRRDPFWEDKQNKPQRR